MTWINENTELSTQHPGAFETLTSGDIKSALNRIREIPKLTKRVKHLDAAEELFPNIRIAFDDVKVQLRTCICLNMLALL